MAVALTQLVLEASLSSARNQWILFYREEFPHVNLSFKVAMLIMVCCI